MIVGRKVESLGLLEKGRHRRLVSHQFGLELRVQLVLFADSCDLFLRGAWRRGAARSRGRVLRLDQVLDESLVFFNDGLHGICLARLSAKVLDESARADLCVPRFR